MTPLEKELRANFERFSRNSTAEAQKAATILDSQKEVFFESYKRIATLQAWRAEVLEPQVSVGSLQFFLEAQNDTLLSHLFARLGIWRPALQALRSAVENTFQMVYYKDHPVELQLWYSGNHRMAFKELRTYVKEHPYMQGTAARVADLPVLEAEYATLSRAVHASAVHFRTTGNATRPQFFRPDTTEVAKWSTRERVVIIGLNSLLAVLFRAELSGTRSMGLRRSMYLVLPSARRQALKDIKVTLVS